MPSPFKRLDLSGCKLTGLPYPVVAGAHCAYTSTHEFELQRKQEILDESDSSSDEEEEIVKKPARKRDDDDEDDDDDDEEDDDDEDGEEELQAQVKSLSTSQRKSMNARAIMKAEKKAAKKERRERVAPLIGLENTCELVLSDNLLSHFPVAVETVTGRHLLKEVSLMCCHFKCLTSLNLARNRLATIDPDLFSHTKALTSLDLSFNQMVSLPDSLVESTTRLESLVLDHNRIKYLPAKLGDLQQLAKLTASFNQLECLPDSVSSLASLHTISLANNDNLKPPELVEAVKIGRRAILRVLLNIENSMSLSNRSHKFCPRETTTVRRLAGGHIAQDEAALPPSSGSEEEEEEEEAEEVKPKPMKPPKSEILVYDHHGDLLDHATREAYLCKTYTLFYQVERVIPPKKEEINKAGGFN
mmetsp:Transcript_49638/g.63621  ORF Transcript_49638/g.63621 Transcript_49638/m.63621 type:complete len:416 (+) Transcript_49638:1-1248(+)